MAGEEEGGGGDRPPWKVRIRRRMPESGVALFVIFLASLVAGLLLALTGHPSWSMGLLAIAIVSMLSSLLTPSPATMARRMAREEPPLEPGWGEGPPADDGESGPELVEATAAPTSTRRGAPVPPLEPPPLEDLVVDLEGGD